MTHLEIIELLVTSGFETGWAIEGTKLVLWQHEQDPPAPLERPADE